MIPSPTMATLPCFFSFLMTASLPSGSTPAMTSSTPACFPMALAVCSLSPVSITTLIPIFLSCLTASGLSSFIVSATAMIPQSLSSAAKNRGVFPSFENSTDFARISSDTFTNLLTKARFPAFIILPASIAVRPFPTTALKSVTSATAISSVLARSIMAFASGCSLLASTDAAIARSFLDHSALSVDEYGFKSSALR